jgi:hypothetical protein
MLHCVRLPHAHHRWSHTSRSLFLPIEDLVAYYSTWNFAQITGRHNVLLYTFRMSIVLVLLATQARYSSNEQRAPEQHLRPTMLCLFGETLDMSKPWESDVESLNDYLKHAINSPYLVSYGLAKRGKSCDCPLPKHVSTAQSPPLCEWLA